MLFYRNLSEYIKGQKEKLDRLADAKIPVAGLIARVLGPNDNQDKSSDVANYSVTKEVEALKLDYQGIIGDRHRGTHRPSTGRERFIFPKGTEIRQHRHVFAVSPYDCEVLSGKLGVEVTPELLGANLVIGDIANRPYSLSELPENSHLLISPGTVSHIPHMPIVVLTHYVKQQGCGITGNAIAEHYGDKSLTRKFMEASKDNRGIVCSVEYPVEEPATLEVGQKIFFMFPTGISP